MMKQIEESYDVTFRLTNLFQDGDKALIGVVEPISILRQDGAEEDGVLAKVDTGEDWSQIDKVCSRTRIVFRPTGT